MTLDLTGKEVVATGGKHSVGRAIAVALAREGADVKSLTGDPGWVTQNFTSYSQRFFE